ncbi:glycosyltransferase family 2 protein [Methylobacter sp. S3L5C]|uniref:glycosyltransferase family 2 protein n=1 Tax=Methylobacter sp. S3L5C TaxID=2839024 RepID=UPI001FAE377B|nr:glycosyltransferase family 2 protein [Methylobacter sp. S3L5C]UOA09134.1 glycosyltransferase family 2 protein [Methylobacter sp. S3L5C]
MITTLFFSFILLAKIVILCLTLPGTTELFVLTIAALLQKKHPVINRSIRKSSLPRLIVVVPAHNEADGIAACITNLQSSLNQTTGCDLIIIADNCQDTTADIAEKSGARVLIREDKLNRGKGYALNYAFTRLLAENYDGFLVIDADSRINRQLIRDFQYAFAQGVDALQCRYRIANPEDSRRSRLQYIAWLAFNELRLFGREKLGVSVGILGNGFALNRTVLEAVPYEAGSIAEDMEYHLRLVAAGFKVHFLNTAIVSSDAPNQNTNAEVQRTRWEGGRFRLMMDHVPSLFLRVLRGQWRLLEPLAELLLLPLAFHVLLLFFALLIPCPLLQYYAITGLLLVVAHVMIAIRFGGGGFEEIKVLTTVPFYILWKLTLLPKLWRNSRKNAAWQRTDRENS